MILNHNIPSLNIFTAYQKALASQSKAMSNISSGIKVNSAADSPYAIAQNDQFNMQLRGMQMGANNAQNSVNLLQVADGGLAGITDTLQRIRTLAVQAANGTNSSQDKSDTQVEISNLVKNIDTLAKGTNMNGVSLLNTPTTTPPTTVTAMIGSNVGETITIPTYDLTASKLNLSGIDVSTNVNATTTIATVDAALKQVTSAMSKYGSIETRLNDYVSSSDDISNQVQAADGNVMDADMASEMLNYSKSSLMVQAGIAMMAQTNKFPQQVLSILQNVK
ncbi:flagellin [Clostridium akagii]|uniref:flagellin N-terminal helical domain-containing protein n=1 Tax=Clostridium akagii TaxID=91623 RepID=UPI00047AA971|nr:flagellin [Clostridium akagii]